jgi:phage terminase large subunit-like protein
MTPEQRKTLLANLKPKAEDIKALPKQAADELFREAEAAADFKRKNKLFTLYPETGPLRRELYPKHMAFFRAGRNYNERAVIAGNRCVSAFTPIEMGSSTRLISEILGKQAFSVTSWDGTTRCKKKAGGVFLKSIAPMFRLHLDNGQALDCTSEHRVLTVSGWVSLSQFAQLSCGLHCKQIAEDCPANCGVDAHPYDGQLPFWLEAVSELLPSQGDAHTPLPYDLIVDEAGSTHRYTQHSLIFDHSLAEDCDFVHGLCQKAVSRSAEAGRRWSDSTLQSVLLFLDKKFRSLLKSEVQTHLCQHKEGSGRIQETQFSECSTKAFSGQFQDAQLYFELVPSGRLNPESLGDTAHRSIFLPLAHPKLVGNQKILIIESLGMQPVLDFTVEETHNYESGGVINHNTGKSFGIGGYETALHLTGLYPPFWEGRRFHYPIEAWVAGDTSETTRDIIQQILLGNPGELGTGLIPYDCILGNPTHRAGVAGAVDTVRVRHVSGGTSWCGFKCFAAGTLVTMNDASLKKVEDIAVGEAVLCAGGSAFPVSATFHYPAAPLVRIRAQLGEITVTPNHKMFTQRGKIPAGELTILDQLELGAIPGEFDQIYSIDLLESSEVYCIEVESKHELIANGYRVSNSYDQGRAKFQGTSKDLCWLDEQCPLDVYTECLTRLLTRNGIIMLTFTPLDGLTDVVLKYLPHMAPDTEDDNIGVDLV